MSKQSKTVRFSFIALNILFSGMPVLTIIFFGSQYDQNLEFFVSLAIASILTPFLLLGSDYEYLFKFNHTEGYEFSLLSIFLLLVALIAFDAFTSGILLMFYLKRVLSVISQVNNRILFSYFLESGLTGIFVFIYFVFIYFTSKSYIGGLSLILAICIFLGVYISAISIGRARTTVFSVNNSIFELLNVGARQSMLQIPVLLVEFIPGSTVLDIKTVQLVANGMIASLSQAVMKVRRSFQKSLNFGIKYAFAIWVEAICMASVVFVLLPFLLIADYYFLLSSFLPNFDISNSHLVFFVFYFILLMAPPFNIRLFAIGKSHILLLITFLSIAISTCAIYFGAPLEYFHMIAISLALAGNTIICYLFLDEKPQ